MSRRDYMNRRDAAQFARVLYRNYLSQSEEVRGVIDNMSRVVMTSQDEDERESALSTLAEAMFPKLSNGPRMAPPLPLRNFVREIAARLDMEDVQDASDLDLDYEVVDDLLNLDDALSEDLSEVEFSAENFSCAEVLSYAEGDKIMGFQQVNGIPFLGCMAGGDWEIPIYFLIYWDGSQFRGYIPKDGNTVNPKNDSAYGNDPEADGTDAVDTIQIDIDQDKIIADIQRNLVSGGS